jgi:hypothetical protein
MDGSSGRFSRAHRSDRSHGIAQSAAIISGDELPLPINACDRQTAPAMLAAAEPTTAAQAGGRSVAAPDAMSTSGL